MMSLVLQHLETLRLDLTAIDPAQRTDAADKVAAMASELRRTVTDATSTDWEPGDDLTVNDRLKH